MGNQVCCQDNRQESSPIDNINYEIQLNHEQKPKINEHLPPAQLEQAQKVQNKHQDIYIYPAVKQTLAKHSFFMEELGNSYAPRNYGNDIYEGAIDEATQKPQGVGRMHKSDGSLYIGYFSKGKAEGKGAYIFPDGSFVEGEFSDNKVNCSKGYYQSGQVKYIGGFKDNVFEGKGKQQGPNYTFEGEFLIGKRINGSLKWKNEDNIYSYTGSFNQKQQFHGQGLLVEAAGTYEGEFASGLKEGRGVYRGANKVRYQGQYKGGKKQGFGVIYNMDDTIAYKGELKNGLPHGKGAAYVENEINETQWVQGIDQIILKSLDEQ